MGKERGIGLTEDVVVRAEVEERRFEEVADMGRAMVEEEEVSLLLLLVMAGTSVVLL
jgi:hypothetical protein